MSNTILAIFECPYCGHKTKWALTLADEHPLIVLCENEEGGCDCYYVGDFRIIVETQSYAVPELAQ